MRFSRSFAAALVSAAVLGAAVNVRAATVIAGDNQLGTGTADFTPTYVVSSTDLINGLTPTAASGDFTLEASGGTPALTNGSFGVIHTGSSGSDHLSFATGGEGGGSGSSVTYTLASPSTINSLAVYGGWNDNGRDEQKYAIYIATTDNPTFTELSLASATTQNGPTVSGNVIDYNPSIAGSIQDATRVTISDDGGAPLATNVTGIRFDFGTAEIGATENGYDGYAEIDVIGTPTPEPASLGLFAVASLGLLRRRRR